MSVQSLSQVRALFRNAGVSTVYVKRLAPKQDNEKNQVFLGSSPSGLSALFPGKISLGRPSESQEKKNSRPGAPKTEVSLDFHWMNSDGELFAAPNTKLIDYLQYPETRLSGFLSDNDWAPKAMRRDEQARYGLRILLLGSTHSGRVIGLLLTELEDPLVAEFPELPVSTVSGVLSILTIPGDAFETPSEILAGMVRKIIADGAQKSIRNKAGEIIPFKGNQGAGYTLEALLGVETNALKEPDILGHEVKSYRGSKLSLMTPAADGGPEGLLAFREFMAKYGSEAKKGDGSLRFTGVARVGKINKGRGTTLRVVGYDPATDWIDDPEKVALELVIAATGEVLSSWSLQKLAESWAPKHAFAVYVKAEKVRSNDENDWYRYLSPFYMCEGTDILRLLKAIALGEVYYDPGHAIYASGEPWQRPQWRMSTASIEKKLAILYERVRKVE